MEFGGLPPEGAMLAPQNGLVDPGLLPQQNGGLEAGEGGELGPGHGPGGVGDGYQYEQQGPTIDAEFTEIHTVMADGADRGFSVAYVSFDKQEELIWVGNTGGHLTSYYGLDMQKYTSFQVHPTNEIRQILTMEGKVLSLTSDCLRVSTKFGRRVFDHVGEGMQDMQCMILTPNNSLLLGGHRAVVMEYDVQAQQEIRQMEVSEPGCAILKFSHSYLCAGDTSGKVTLRDPNSLAAEHVLDAHSGTLSDFDVHGNQLITCGFGSRRGNMVVDHFLKVYDLRMARAVAPIQVAIEPLFLKFVPTYTDRICVVSQTGQFQLVEQGAMTPASMVMYQVQTEGAFISAFDISDTQNCIMFGDSHGFLHLFSTSGENLTFNQFSAETEFAPMPESHPPMSLQDDMTPLSLIPMFYPTGGQRLLSDWPEEMCSRIYRQPKPIEADILRSMKVVQNVGYAPNPGTRRRNQVNYLSPSSSNKRRGKNVPSSPLGRGDDPFVVVPKRYRRVEIKYSKLGVEDFDFRHYNQTNFAGLETHIPNAYCNAMLQVLYFLEPLRCGLLSHLCDKEFCLACELGFLFHMLDRQKGKTCQASNFLRAFRTIPEASTLGLILSDTEESMGKSNLARLIQSWNRFILLQVHSEFVEAGKERPSLLSPTASSLSTEWNMVDDEYKVGEEAETFDSEALKREVEKIIESEERPGGEEGRRRVGAAAAGEGRVRTLSEGLEEADPEPAETETQQASKSDEQRNSIIRELFGTDLVNSFKCRCGNVMSRPTTNSLFDLVYPDITSGGSKPPAPLQYTFAQVVQQSMCLEQMTQAWCPVCKKYQPHLQTKTLKGLPDVLVFNCHLENTRDYDFWRMQEELVRKKDGEDSGTLPVSSSITSGPGGYKMCRYGNACKRKDCKFRHESDSGGDAALDASRLTEEVSEVNWVPFGLRLRLTEDKKLEVWNIDDEDGDKPDADILQFDLFGTVAHIRDPRTGGNLVSHIHGTEAYHQRKENVTCQQWYLFNDFSITPIEKKESVWFNMDWKVPCCLFFCRADIMSKYDCQVENKITSEALFLDTSLVTPTRKLVTFTPLDTSELPTVGDVVGIDAEFVTLNQEEAELRSDGTRSTIKPSQMSLARVTCVRSSGPLAGEPFIDDYISTQEQVVDYLTQFSGIKPGDLDATVSSKHLTTLKATYAKLRHLVDAGVIFVGHGLKKDFRVINLIVPKDQVIDTVELFHLPRQRMISLKFLAWYFLDMKIQSVTHDSIEDARTAIKLYHKYQELTAVGMDHVNEKLDEMYDKGRSLKWTIPGDEKPDTSIEFLMQQQAAAFQE